ncbi:related to alpha-amylase [Ramularia collo-cygni]|uniref:Related to alpha-amylase n=1 Tax=Ramularia collo-cygni TaxID=112498 RepID=A0A2D3VAQ9_9PEZI|nr:related to alpha-amylase [Ramularia collo-cygni]CZT24040.1 related to alpha-amylase [Ramularia collo-cygni]
MAPLDLGFAECAVGDTGHGADRGAEKGNGSLFEAASIASSFDTASSNNSDIFSTSTTISSSSSTASFATSNMAADDKERPWWKGQVCYQVWPMSFKDSNGDGIGDIPGIISKLDYLKDLGIDVIWLSPTYKSPMNDWGYDISDYQDIEQRFGTLQDMEQLISEVHKKGMRILLDLVITHTSTQHKWFEQSVNKGDTKDWYIWGDKRPGNKIGDELVEEPTNWRAAFGGSAWTWVPARGQYYLHLFLESQPDLNWENPELREAVYDSAVKFWLDRGVDGFRVDTANRYCKDTTFPDAEIAVDGKWQPGSKYYINGPKVHDWLKELSAKIARDAPEKDLVLVGELPLTPYDELLRYVKPAENELSMVFDFDVIKLGNNDTPDEFAKHEVSNYTDGDDSYTLPSFKTAIQKVQQLITDTDAWGTIFQENHDQPRSISRYATGDPQYWRQAGKLLALLQTTLSGTEFIYQGQEIGMLNMPATWDFSEFRDPDALIYIEDYVKAHPNDPNAREKAISGVFKVGRDNSRTPMQWSNEPNGGFTGSDLPWMNVNPNYTWLNVEAQKIDTDSIWHFWKARIEMRKEYRELFMFGAFELHDYENSHTFTYSKTAADGQTALVVLNFSREEVPLNATQKALLGDGYRLLASNYGETKGSLQAWEGRAYLLT